MPEHKLTQAEQEFLQAFENIVLFDDIDIDYRIYYNETGITGRGLTNHPQTNYIAVSEEIYETYYLYTVENDKLVKLENDPGYQKQLYRNDNSGKFEVVKKHAGLILESDDQYNETEYYEFRDN